MLQNYDVRLVAGFVLRRPYPLLRGCGCAECKQANKVDVFVKMGGSLPYFFG